MAFRKRPWNASRETGCIFAATSADGLNNSGFAWGSLFPATDIERITLSLAAILPCGGKGVVCERVKERLEEPEDVVGNMLRYGIEHPSNLHAVCWSILERYPDPNWGFLDHFPVSVPSLEHNRHVGELNGRFRSGPGEISDEGPSVLIDVG